MVWVCNFNHMIIDNATRLKSYIWAVIYYGMRPAYSASTSFSTEPGFSQITIRYVGSLIGIVGYAETEQIELAANTINNSFEDLDPESDSEAIERAERILNQIVDSS